MPDHPAAPTAAAPPRSIALDGASNVRDLGGWRTGDGRRVRHGLVYRGAALGRLTEADMATLAGMGLRTVCDLRGQDERARWPSRAASLDGVAVHELPVEPTVGASLHDILARRDLTGQDALGLLRTAYVAYALDWSERYRAMFDLLVEGATPLLMHCTAGKDRTGWGAALLLTALGVTQADIRVDYLATNDLWRPDPAVVGRFPTDVANALLGAHAELLDAAFAAAAESAGTIDAYLEQRMSLTRQRRATLHARLLEDA